MAGPTVGIMILIVLVFMILTQLISERSEQQRRHTELKELFHQLESRMSREK